jgi:hypothetical protein
MSNMVTTACTRSHGLPSSRTQIRRYPNAAAGAQYRGCETAASPAHCADCGDTKPHD